MIYFDSHMSKSTNTVVYFDWILTVIYTYACGILFFLTKGKSEVMLELTFYYHKLNASH
jgi:hypothetical protein